MSIPTIFGNRTRRFRYGTRFLFLARGQLLLSGFLEAGRINPSQIRWRARKQFALLFLPLIFSPFVRSSFFAVGRSVGTSSCNVRTLERSRVSSSRSFMVVLVALSHCYLSDRGNVLALSPINPSPSAGPTIRTSPFFLRGLLLRLELSYENVCLRLRHFNND